MRIVLVHGVLGFGVLGPLEYFNGVKRHLRARFAAEVFVAQVPPIGSVEERGRVLAAQIAARFDARERVHLLAHSMGGLDARWALRHVDGFARRVETLVCIGTPHHGSPVADAIERSDPALLRHIPLPIRVELEINQAALHDLTTAQARKFDRETGDAAGVNYLYVRGDVTQPGSRCAHVFRATQAVFGLDEPNDGIVPARSAVRGGDATPLATWPVDHGGLIGWNLDRPIPVSLPFSDASHLQRYDDIIRGL